MGYNYDARQEGHRTFLHEEGIKVIGKPYIAPNLMTLPSVRSSRFELRALTNYVKKKKHPPGRPLPTMQQLDKITFNNLTGCWELPIYRDGNDVYPEGSVNAGMPRARYGRVKIPGIEDTLAHRAYYIVMRGEIPKLEGVERGGGAYLDHLCENKQCCYHRHLEPVTPQENNQRIRLAAFAKLGQGILFHDGSVVSKES